MALGRKTGGRQKGAPNKATRELKATFQKHGDELVEALLKLTKSDDERVRLGAIQAALLGQADSGRGSWRGNGDNKDRARHYRPYE